MLSAFEARKITKPSKHLGSPLVTEEAASTVSKFIEFLETKIRESCENSQPNMHFNVNYDSYLSPIIYEKTMDALKENGYDRARCCDMQYLQY